MAMLSVTMPRILGLATRRETAAIAVVVALGVFGSLGIGASRVGFPEPVKTGWIGELASLSGAPQQVRSEPMTSSSLVVPSEALTLPPVVRPPVHAKATCDSADRSCVVRITALATPPKKPAATTAGTTIQKASLATDTPVKETGFSLNPLNHIPDMSVLGRPLNAASAAVSGWIHRL